MTMMMMLVWDGSWWWWWTIYRTTKLLGHILSLPGLVRRRRRLNDVLERREIALNNEKWFRKFDFISWIRQCVEDGAGEGTEGRMARMLRII